MGASDISEDNALVMLAVCPTGRVLHPRRGIAESAMQAGVMLAICAWWRVGRAIRAWRRVVERR